MSGQVTADQQSAGVPVVAGERLIAGVRRWAWLKQPLSVWLLSRLLFLILTYFGVILFRSSLHGAQPPLLHALLPAWDRWDARWYADIANRGYDWHNPAGTSPTAFFPLFPLLVHIVAAATGRTSWLIGLVLANALFIAALAYLWRLTEWELGEEVAGRTVLYVSVFPTALFFFAGYTESLFLLLTVAAFFHMRRGQWIAGGMFAALASATRVTGVLLFVPLAYEYARSCNFRPREMMGSGLLALLLVPSGLIAFMVYLHAAVGNAFAFTQAQVAWQKIFTLNLAAGFLESFRQILVVQPHGSFFEAHNVINVGLGGLFLVWTFFAAGRLPAAYTLYLISFWLVTLASPAMAAGYPVPLISLSRYILVLFPIFMYMGTLGGDRRWNDCYLVLASGFLAVLTVQFINNGWVI